MKIKPFKKKEIPHLASLFDVGSTGFTALDGGQKRVWQQQMASFHALAELRGLEWVIRLRDWEGNPPGVRQAARDWLAGVRLPDPAPKPPRLARCKVKS